MDKKNIMILTPSLTGGGAEKVAANLSLGLKDSMNVYVVTYLECENEYQYSGVRINLNLQGKNKLSKAIIALKRIIILKRLKRKYKINCSISFAPQCDYANIFSKIKYEKVLIDVGTNVSVAFPTGLNRLFRKYILTKADYVVTVSKGVQKDIIQNFGISENRTKTIYNSCDIDSIKKNSMKKNKHISISLPDKYILTVGSFRRPKGHWHLIKAFSTIANDFPNYKLVICGEGPYRKEYEKLIKLLGIQNRVLMPGFLNPPHAVMSSSELFVFSSIYEGFGNVIIEAMACGVPVISTDCEYGPREILAPNMSLIEEIKEPICAKYGMLVPAFSLDDIDISNDISENEIVLGQAIKYMLESPTIMESYRDLGLSYCHDFENTRISSFWVDMIGDLIYEKAK